MKRLLLCLGVVLSLSGCGTSPEPNLYTLSKLDGAPSHDVKAAIKIQRPVIAGYLDRLDFVQEDGDEISTDDMKRWAEPVDRMVERILAEDLRQRLPSSLIMTDLDTPPDDARFIVSADIGQFNVIASGEVALKANITIRDKLTQQVEAMPVTLTAPASQSADGVAAALSNLIGQWSDQLEGQFAILAMQTRR